MNTGKLVTVLHEDNTSTKEPEIWCDICGWAARNGNNPEAKYHFCHRHKQQAIDDFLSGKKPGYFQLKERMQSEQQQRK